MGFFLPEATVQMKNELFTHFEQRKFFCVFDKDAFVNDFNSYESTT